MIFTNCQNCGLYLSGQRRKFCCDYCGDIYRAKRSNKKVSDARLKELVRRTDRNYMLKLNSSEDALKELSELTS